MRIREYVTSAFRVRGHQLHRERDSALRVSPPEKRTCFTCHPGTTGPRRATVKKYRTAAAAFAVVGGAREAVFAAQLPSFSPHVAAAVPVTWDPFKVDPDFSNLTFFVPEAQICYPF